MGRTVLLKSCAKTAELRDAIWARKSDEHKIGRERTFCRDIGRHPVQLPSAPDVFAGTCPTHLKLISNDLAKFQRSKRTKMELARFHFGKPCSLWQGTFASPNRNELLRLSCPCPCA